VISRRSALAGLALGGTARAAPQGPRPGIMLVVGASPGTAPDRAARLFAPFLERALAGAPVLVANVPGRAGATAIEAVAMAAPDGNTLGLASATTIGARLLDRRVDYRLHSFTWLGALAAEGLVLAVPPQGARTLDDLLRRAAAVPGTVTIGSAGEGSAGHLWLAAMARARAVEPAHVPFPGPGPARAACAAGQLAAAVLPVGEAAAWLRDGRLRGLCTSFGRRAPHLPDLPTCREAGVPLDWSGLRGVIAPAGLPPAQAVKLSAALASVLRDPDLAGLLAAEGAQPAWLDAASWGAAVEAESARLAALWQAAPWQPFNAS
jgi:tripartite-type tricarboxylate transporter receptor subunit TctC